MLDLLLLYTYCVLYIRHIANIYERANKLNVKEIVVNYNFHRLNFKFFAYYKIFRNPDRLVQ